eukprot:snap_masked-scaffold_8-processed-gene-5.49-mRNA-1 protein AED:1.00 eAED:1.00 QI:0/0/0/0/1/1/2/0/71
MSLTRVVMGCDLHFQSPGILFVTDNCLFQSLSTGGYDCRKPYALVTPLFNPCNDKHRQFYQHTLKQTCELT